MIQLRLRSTWRLNFLIVGSVFALVLFGSLFAAHRDWLSGAFAAISLAGLVRFLWAKWEVASTPSTLIELPSAPATRQPIGSSEEIRVVRVQQVTRYRKRAGYVIFGRSTAGFVPTSKWRFIWRVGSYVTEIDVQANDPATIDRELAELSRAGGFVVDSAWVWLSAGHQLVRTQDKSILIFEQPLPQSWPLHWARAPVQPERRRQAIRWVLMGGTALIVVLLLMGTILWKVRDDVEYLLGFGFWAALAGVILVTVVLRVPRD